MKKNILFILILFIFNACSESQNESQNEGQNNDQNSNSIFISKIETTTNGITSTDNYIYYLNKLSYISHNGYFIHYHYTGSNTNYISDIAYDFNDIDNINFQYSYGKISNINTTLSNSPNSGTQISLTYNNDETIDYQKTLYITYYSGNHGQFSNTIGYPQGTGKYTFQNGNLVKDEFSGIEYNEVTNYSYDTKNKPTKNILGFNKIFENGTFSMNNIISINQIRNNTPSGGSISQTTKNTTFHYIYNADNFPISSIKTVVESDQTTISTIKYFY